MLTEEVVVFSESEGVDGELSGRLEDLEMFAIFSEVLDTGEEEIPEDEEWLGIGNPVRLKGGKRLEKLGSDIAKCNWRVDLKGFGCFCDAVLSIE